jgi:hypothetical protein
MIVVTRRQVNAGKYVLRHVGIAKSTRIGHAARHLQTCEYLAKRIEAFGDHIDHDAFVADRWLALDHGAGDTVRAPQYAEASSLWGISADDKRQEVSD